MKIIKTYESDWLGSNPIFYNEKTYKVSYNINEVIDFKNFNFHPEGFNNYLDFGYSVFGQTPINNVKFLRWSSKLNILEDGTFSIENLSDPVEPLLSNQTNEVEIMELIRDRIKRWENNVSGNIIIPTSGGYDSRLLNFLVNEKQRVLSFSYGFSDDQKQSHEVVYAKNLSEILGTRWEHIQLGYFYNYFNQWDSLFGVSTHAHGMYQMEFYDQIVKKISGENSVLSGIIGDAWAGSVNIGEIDEVHKLNLLGYTHGMRADSKYSKLKSVTNLKSAYFEENRKKFLSNEKWKVIEAMRFKMILLSYLVKIPKLHGLNVFAPFLDIDIAIGMLNLPAERKKRRLWQRDFFRTNKINLEEQHFRVDKRNSLNLQSAKKVRLPPLQIDLLQEVMDIEYLEWINNKISRLDPDSFEFFTKNLMRLPLVGRLYKVLKYNTFEQNFLKAFFAYITLKPLESVLLKRNSN